MMKITVIELSMYGILHFLVKGLVNMDVKLDIVSFIVGLTSLISSIGILLKTRSDIKKSKMEEKKLASESKKLDSDGRKVEVEVAEKFITSAGELIGTYKDMLNTFTEKYAELENKLGVLQEGLDKEIARRVSLEKMTVEIYRGVKVLLRQQEKANMIPDWKPNKSLEKELIKLESMRYDWNEGDEK